MADAGAGAIAIPGVVLDDIVAHAAAEAPREACGLLVGRGREVRRSVRARNAAASPARYEVDPHDHFAAIRGARADGLEVIGAYHSHPAAPAEPSPTDREHAFEDFVFVIAALQPSPHARAWTLEAGNFAERPLVRT
jgi:proteasome lid subunit RPN8/RPN11